MTTLAERLKFAMKKRDMSQEHLAEKIGISQTTIHKIITGKSKRSKYINEIAQALQVPVNWLYSGDIEQIEGEREALPSMQELPPPPLTPDHARLIKLYDGLPESEQKRILAVLEERREYFHQIYLEMQGKMAK